MSHQCCTKGRRLYQKEFGSIEGQSGSRDEKQLTMFHSGQATNLYTSDRSEAECFIGTDCYLFFSITRYSSSIVLTITSKLHQSTGTTDTQNLKALSRKPIKGLLSPLFLRALVMASKDPHRPQHRIGTRRRR
jgi:hypothetical protein